MLSIHTNYVYKIETSEQFSFSDFNIFVLSREIIISYTTNTEHERAYRGPKVTYLQKNSSSQSGRCNKARENSETVRNRKPKLVKVGERGVEWPIRVTLFQPSSIDRTTYLIAPIFGTHPRGPIPTFRVGVHSHPRKCSRDDESGTGGGGVKVTVACGRILGLDEHVQTLQSQERLTKYKL